MKVLVLDAVQVFIEKLDAKETAKVLHTIELLESFGHDLDLPHSRHMRGGILELRVAGKRAVRILYCFHKGEAVLLHAFVKKSQKTPARELERARSRMERL